MRLPLGLLMSYRVSTAAVRPLVPTMRLFVPNELAPTFVPNTTDFTAVGEALGLLDFADFLAGGGQKIRVAASRLVDYETIKKGNTILLGGNQSWSGRIFLYKDGFEFHNGVITNYKPLQGEQAVYRPEFDPVTGALSRDYALILDRKSVV